MLRKSLPPLCSKPAASGPKSLYNVKGLIVTKTKNKIDPTAPGIATITLNVPKSKNSLTPDMYKGIGQAFDDFSHDDSVGAIVLTGCKETDYYCSGNNLRNLVSMGWPRQLAADAKVLLYDYVNSYIACRKPIVVGVSGGCIGIAATTALLCDYRYCLPTSTFHTPFKKLGQAPEGCSSYLFPKVMGKDLARKMLADGYKMPADEALKCGFMHEILADKDALAAKCESTAFELACGKLPVNHAQSKLGGGGKGVRYSVENKVLLSEVNKTECEILEEAWVSKECFKAIEDFMVEKKNPTGAWVMRIANATRPIWDRK